MERLLNTDNFEHKTISTRVTSMVKPLFKWIRKRLLTCAPSNGTTVTWCLARSNATLRCSNAVETTWVWCCTANRQQQTSQSRHYFHPVCCNNHNQHHKPLCHYPSILKSHNWPYPFPRFRCLRRRRQHWLRNSRRRLNSLRNRICWRGSKPLQTRKRNRCKRSSSNSTTMSSYFYSSSATIRLRHHRINHRLGRYRQPRPQWIVSSSRPKCRKCSICHVAWYQPASLWATCPALAATRDLVLSTLVQWAPS